MKGDITMSTFKEMTVMEKADHIWEYYKIHIIAGLFVLLFAGSMINHLFINKPKALLVNLSLLGGYVDTNRLSDFGDKLTEALLDDPEAHEEVKIDFFTFDDQGDIQLAMASRQKFMAMTSIQEIDVLIADRAEFESLAYQGYFKPLDTVLDPSTLEDFYDRLITARSEEDSEDFYYGIAADDIRILSEISYPTEGKVLGIVINTPRPEKAVELVQLLFQQ